MHPTITAVVPLYNKKKRVANCLFSIINQNVYPDEIIVVDDGSTDGSAEIAEEILSTCLIKNKLIRQKNKGVSTARNIGVKYARSDFIAFLDADDEWFPEFIEKSRSLILDFNDSDLYCFSHMVHDEKNGLFIPKHGLPRNHRGYVDDFFHSSSKGSVANSSKVVLRKKTFLHIGGFVEGVKVGEDLFLWMQIAQSGTVVFDGSLCAVINQGEDESRSARVGNIPYPLTYYAKAKKLLKHKTTIRLYLWKMAYSHIFGAFASNQINTAFNLATLSFKIFPVRSFYLLPLFLLPMPFFKFLRNIRRKFMSSVLRI